MKLHTEGASFNSDDTLKDVSKKHYAFNHRTDPVA